LGYVTTLHQFRTLLSVEVADRTTCNRTEVSEEEVAVRYLKMVPWMCLQLTRPSPIRKCYLSMCAGNGADVPSETRASVRQTS
jgi:hypothetical protein